MIEVQGLRKEYGDLVAVDDVTFAAQSGEVFGLLGPNGAGKSTTIGCLSGLIPPTAGVLKVQGHDIVGEPRQARRARGIRTATQGHRSGRCCRSHLAGPRGTEERQFPRSGNARQ